MRKKIFFFSLLVVVFLTSIVNFVVPARVAAADFVQARYEINRPAVTGPKFSAKVFDALRRDGISTAWGLWRTKMAAMHPDSRIPVDARVAIDVVGCGISAVGFPKLGTRILTTSLFWVDASGVHEEEGDYEGRPGDLLDIAGTITEAQCRAEGKCYNAQTMTCVPCK